MKKHTTHKRAPRPKNNYSRYVLIAFLALVLSIPFVTASRSYTNGTTVKGTILGEQSTNTNSESKEQTQTKEGTEKAEEPEQTETPEPTESPEPKEPQEQEAEIIHKDVEQKIEHGQVERIETNYPVIIDPQTKTVAMRTETGITVINMFPSQILPQLSPANKPTTTQSVRLTNDNNQPTYLISGQQTRRFAGIFPVEAQVKTRVSAHDGSLLSVDEPWYFRNLGFLYSL